MTLEKITKLQPKMDQIKNPIDKIKFLDKINKLQPGIDKIKNPIDKIKFLEDFNIYIMNKDLSWLAPSKIEYVARMNKIYGLNSYSEELLDCPVYLENKESTIVFEEIAELYKSEFDRRLKFEDYEGILNRGSDRGIFESENGYKCSPVVENFKKNTAIDSYCALAWESA